MEKVKWQDLLNVLTSKGHDTGSTEKVFESPEYEVKYSLCRKATQPYLEKWLEHKIKEEKKNASMANEFRLKGNKFYLKGNDFEALNHYNLSAVFAPYQTNEFALALSNRSAVLARLDKKEEAIQDIDLALQHGNEDIPRLKILTRKAILLHKLGLFEECVNVVQTIYPVEADIYAHENAELKDAYFDSVLQKGLGVAKSLNNETRTLPSPKGGENEMFSSASAHAILKYSDEKGRHVIADDDFETSEIIFVEKPFALVVLPDEYWQHCHHCCKDMCGYVPCGECNRALFCSVECRDAAWTRYHQWECRGLEVCHCIGIAHLGLRVALLADDSARYQQVYDLVTHVQDMKADDVYQYTMTAVLLTIYLEKYTDFFTKNLSTKVEEMGSRILRHIAQLVCNGHAITKVDSNRLEKGFAKTLTEAQVRIATAIYPSASMMNHSCDQNIANHFINENLIVKASRKIKKGEEIFNCYGPHYSSSSREERQEVLQSQYHFTCSCVRCAAESEAAEEERLQFSALLCAMCLGPVMEGRAACAHCGTTQLLMELVNLALSAQQLHHEGLKLIKEGNTTEALTCMEECVQVASKCLYKHNSDLRSYKDSLARVYAETERYDEAIALVEECIESVEKQYGADSVEVTREYKKLYGLLAPEMARLKSAGQRQSQDYENKLQKITKALMQMKKSEQSVAGQILNGITDLTEAVGKITSS